MIFIIYRIQHDIQLEEERKQFRSAFSEQEGAIVILESEHDGMRRTLLILEVICLILILYLFLFC